MIFRFDRRSCVNAGPPGPSRPLTRTLTRTLTLALALVPGLAACGAPASTGAPAPRDSEQEASTQADTLRRTATRPIQDVRRRTVGFQGADVWISNELEGGRVNDAWLETSPDTVLVVRVRPENAPINPSPWYAFKVWSGEPRTLPVRLSYEHGRHRYEPVTRTRNGAWTAVDSAMVTVDSITGTATFELEVGPDTLWVAGQEMKTSSFFGRWTDSLAAAPHVTRSVIGTSARGRPIHMLQFGDPSATRHVLLLSRQHPPEVTGTVALLEFVEELAGSSSLAARFREEFRVHVVPLVNPDGVDLGHWRHNTGGVDLNRDWVDFLQPETRQVRDALLRVREDPEAEVWFAADFHSTWRDVFYTLDREYETNPPGMMDRWLDYLTENLPHYELRDSPSGLGSPTSRNWFYREFGAPALTYEVGDRTDRSLIREVAATTARGTMEILLDALESGQ